ncbi:MAG: AAA family ATPase [Oscillospiraceae bacterium]|nr:AAA family ATPase [Oscillospiraceae bacterium]
MKKNNSGLDRRNSKGKEDEHIALAPKEDTFAAAAAGETQSPEEAERRISQLINHLRERNVGAPDTIRARFESMLCDVDILDSAAYKHYSGVLLAGSKDFSESTSFQLQCGKKKIEIRMNSETVVHTFVGIPGQPIHVIAFCIHDKPVAKVVCTEAFYEMFDMIDHLKNKIAAMKHFLKLTVEQQKDIENQLKGKRYPLDEGAQRACFQQKEDLYLKYEMCKNTYTQQQQREIELLFSQRAIGRDKSTRKLEYVLNISNVCGDRRVVRRKDIMQELNKHLYKLDKVKEKVATCLAASNYTTERGMRILLVGRPGTGKTTIARTIAETYGLPFDVIPLGGVISAVDVKGLDSSYDGADVGLLVRSFYSLGTTEAVIVLDEIDKMGTESKDGNPVNALLDTLSDEHMCYDAFLEMGIDTSNTIYIATANSTQGIPDYLLNRFDVIFVDEYEDEDKVAIAERYMVPQILEMYGIGEDEITFDHDALVFVVKNYCSDSGARMLKENIKMLVRSVINTWDETQHREKTTITIAYVQSALESFINENDPAFLFARNKDKFRSDVRTEIRKTLDSLAVQGLPPREKETNLRRVQYLTALIPNTGGFDQFDVGKFYECVDQSHYGLDSVKELIAKCLHSKAIQGKSFSSERLLLQGGAGIGKTSICESIAKALGVPFVRISLNGINDESALKGFSPSYIGADAGEIVKGLARVRTTKAVVQLDEIDKLGAHNGIKASNALFDLLDNCSTFTDRFLNVPIDLSDVLFIATANDVSNMEPWLLDRFHVIYLEGYTKSDKEQILLHYLIPRIEQEYAAIHLKIDMTPAAVTMLIHDYCTSFGVRDLEKAARKIVIDKLYKEPSAAHIKIDSKDIMESMGVKPVPRGNLLKKNVPGFSKALAVTSGNCGMAFAIETAIIPGEDSTCITGLPKESTIDSVKLAKTFIRLNYTSEAKDFGVHLHFGEGAVVKDGPSAGVAILVSMLSAVFHTPVNGNVAYTGEIDLFGNVFAIGGTIAKIQAAADTGCEKVFIPYDNYCQLQKEDIEKFSIEVIPVQHVSEVINVVLPTLRKNKTNNCRNV